MNTQNLERLVTFRSDANHDTFMEIFGDRLGQHLWGEFWRVFEYDVVRWYGGLDNQNREKFADYIQGMKNGK